MSGFTVARLAALVFALAPGITARDAWAQKFFVPIVDSVTPRDAFSPRDSVPQLLEWSWSTSDTALFERGFVPIAYGNGGGPGGAPAMGREILDEARRLGGDLVVVRYITIPKVDRCDLPQLSDKRDAMGRSQHETRCFSAPAENQVFAMVWRKEPVLARKRIYRRPLALRLWVAAGDTAILRGVMEEAARQDPTLDEGILLLAMANARDDVASWVLRSNPDKWMSFARTVWHYVE